MALKVVTIGDSNTVAASYAPGTNDEWPYLMDTALETAYPAQDFTLVNLGVGGKNAHYFVDNIATITAQDPDIAVMMLGTNDTYGDDGVYNADASAALASFNANMTTLITSILAHTNPNGEHPRIVLLQPPIAMNAVYGTRDAYTGFISDPWDSGDPYTYGRPTTRLQAFKDAVDDLGITYGLPVAQVWDNLAALGWSGATNVSNVNILDGVHLTAAGHVLVGGYATTAVETLLDTNGELWDEFDLDVNLLSQYDLDVLLEASASRRRYALMDAFAPTRL